eukprot:1707092-Pleurochrysis_carterae.AAC.1
MGESAVVHYSRTVRAAAEMSISGKQTTAPHAPRSVVTHSTAPHMLRIMVSGARRNSLTFRPLLCIRIRSEQIWRPTSSSSRRSRTLHVSHHTERAARDSATCCHQQSLYT